MGEEGLGQGHEDLAAAFDRGRDLAGSFRGGDRLKDVSLPLPLLGFIAATRVFSASASGC